MKKNVFLVLLSVGAFICSVFNPATANDAIAFLNSNSIKVQSDHNEMEFTGENPVNEKIISAGEKSDDWKYYAKVNSLYFGKFDWLFCIGDASKYNSISERFYELEEEGGYLLKPCNISIHIDYRYFDGEKQYRMYNNKPRGGGYVFFSLNPYKTIEYVIDNNNRPNFREKDVRSYSHVAEVDGALYFIKMF